MSKNLTDEEQADLEILGLANEKRKFAISLGYHFTASMNDAFERGIDNEWWHLIDISMLSDAGTGRALMRVFRLTDAGMARLAELGQKTRV